MSGGPQKPDHRGNFFMVPRRVIDSVAWRYLSPRAKAVLNVVQSGHNGFNNGQIAITIRAIGAAMGDQNHGGNSRAIAQLIEHGFLECMSDADHVHSKSREYRVTFISTGTSKRPVPATHEYLDWRPSPVAMRKFGGARTATQWPVSVADTAAVPKLSDADSAAISTEICGSQLDASDAVTASHIGNQSADSSRLSSSSRNFPPITSNQDGKTRGAGISAAQMPAALREWMKDALIILGFGGQRKMALDAGIPEAAISKFKSGKNLPKHHLLPLQLACARILPFNEWNDAGD